MKVEKNSNFGNVFQFPAYLNLDCHIYWTSGVLFVVHFVHSAIKNFHLWNVEKFCEIIWARECWGEVWRQGVWGAGQELGHCQARRRGRAEGPGAGAQSPAGAELGGPRQAGSVRRGLGGSPGSVCSPGQHQAPQLSTLRHSPGSHHGLDTRKVQTDPSQLYLRQARKSLTDRITPMTRKEGQKGQNIKPYHRSWV